MKRLLNILGETQKKWNISENDLTLDKLKKIINEIVPTFSDKQLILLNGAMGAGKTQSVTYLVEAMGGSHTSSPTFMIHQSYKCANDKVFDHIDLYRLMDDADLESTGFWELLERQSGVIAIEWADRIGGDWIPADWKVLVFDFATGD